VGRRGGEGAGGCREVGGGEWNKKGEERGGGGGGGGVAWTGLIWIGMGIDGRLL
jgi:hypothetical protein